MVRQNATGLQWLFPASAGWATDINFQAPQYLPYLRGALGVAIRRGEIPGLKDFLLKIHPDNGPYKSYEDNIVSLALALFWCLAGYKTAGRVIQTKQLPGCPGSVNVISVQTDYCQLNFLGYLRNSRAAVRLW